mmetsp:Transcript_31460/g.50511  ORF Transcript_31460/g.50511 Transcript_31460/m.50511 type:complete len:318 (+) Transcript_31460:413-1366(+)
MEDNENPLSSHRSNTEKDTEEPEPKLDPELEPKPKPVVPPLRVGPKDEELQSQCERPSTQDGTIAKNFYLDAIGHTTSKQTVKIKKAEKPTPPPDSSKDRTAKEETKGPEDIEETDSSEKNSTHVEEEKKKEEKEPKTKPLPLPLPFKLEKPLPISIPVEHKGWGDSPLPSKAHTDEIRPSFETDLVLQDRWAKTTGINQNKGDEDPETSRKINEKFGPVKYRDMIVQGGGGVHTAPPLTLALMGTPGLGMENLARVVAKDLGIKRVTLSDLSDYSKRVENKEFVEDVETYMKYDLHVGSFRRGVSVSLKASDSAHA